MNSHSDLTRLFNPRSIAVVGASATPSKIGAMPITLLHRYGYTGRIIPINPRADEIQGLKSLSDLNAIEENIDLAILAVPAEHAVRALESARLGQVAGAVVFTSGFSETGDVGRAQQAQLAQVAHARGIRLLGPNCLGFMNVRENAYATFSPAPMNGVVMPGSIGMVSQSGAFGAYAYSMARERGLGLSHWISTGNESDIDVSDCIAWLTEDIHTRVIMVYMEGCRDGAKFKHALKLAHQAGKPVVITKIGRTEAGAQAAASHTAALAGDDAVYDALFRQYGAMRARTVEEFFNLGYALSVWQRPPTSNRLGIITISGGVGALMADDAQDAKLTLPEPIRDVQERLLARVPFASARNPVDVTGQAVSEPGLLLDTASDMLANGDYDALVVFLAAAGSSTTLWPTFDTFARTLHERYPDTPLALCALFPEARRRELEALGCVVFADPSAAVRSIGALACVRRATDYTDVADTSVATQTRVPLVNGPMNEVQSLDFLRAAGVPAVPARLVRTATEAVTAAGTMAGEVVLKVVSRDILHKSDIGAVKLGLSGELAVRQAFASITESVKQHAPAANVDGMLVAPLVRGGVECILGVHRDPVFGPVVMFGLGGVFVEIMRDVSFRLAPFDREQALEMISQIKAYPLLQGARGAPPCDVDALADTLVALGQLAHTERASIESIDINPLLVLPCGQGVLAVDAVVIVNHHRAAMIP